MINSIKLYFGHLKNSKKIIFISTIGLICSIAIVSSSLLYVDSTKVEIVNTILSSQSQSSNFDISIQFSGAYPKININDINNEISNASSDLIMKSNLDIFHNLTMFYSLNGLVSPISYVPNPNEPEIYYNSSIPIIQLNEQLKHDLLYFISGNSSLPSYNDSIQQAFLLQTYLNYPSSQTSKFQHNYINIANSSVINLFYNANNIEQTFPFNITGSGKIILNYTLTNYGYSFDYPDDTYPALSVIFNRYGFGGPTLFVNNLTEIMNKIQPDQDNNYYTQFTAYGGFKIDFSKIDPFSITSKASDLGKFKFSLQDSLVNLNFYQSLKSHGYYMNVDFPNQYIYDGISSTITSIIFNMLLYALPIIIVALFMTNYSFGLIHTNVVRQIGIFKTRGASKNLLFFFELIDFLIIMFISMVIGAIAGLPISSIVTKTSFLLSFNNPKNYDIITTFLLNFSSIIESLFYFAVLISMIVNLRRVFKLASLPIVETENPTEKGEPYWKKHYLDVISFLYGTISYVILIYLTTNPNYVQTIGPVIIIFLFLSLPCPFAMVIGAILIVNRFIPILLNWVGSKLWEASGGLLAFSFKNVIRHRQASTRAVMLIASLLTFLLLFYSMPYSQVAYEQKISLFNNGAEGVIKISNIDSNNLTLIKEKIQNITSILDSNFSDSLSGFSPYFSTAITDNNQFFIEFKFINASSYYQASAINQLDPGVTYDLQRDLKLLQSENKSIIIGQQSFNSRFLSINESLSVNGPTSIFEFPVIDTYKSWPSTTIYTYDSIIYAVIDMNYLLNNNNFSSQFFNGVRDFGFYLNFKDSVNRTLIANELTTIFHLQTSLSNSDIQNWDPMTKLNFQFELGQINTNVLMSLIIGVIIIIMFAYMQLNDRKREIYTERAIGMKLSQTSVLFFIEGIILLMSGVIIGTFLGYFFVQMMALFQTQGNQIPSYDVLTPWNLVLITYTALCMLAVLSALIPAYYVTKQDISKSFGEN